MKIVKWRWQGRRTLRMLRALGSPRVLGHGLFWSWNLLFLCVVLLGLLPLVLYDLVRAALNGDVPPSLLGGALLCVLIPVGGTVAGLLFRRHFRARHGDLLRLFYGLEAPLLVLSLVRVFILRELTTAQAHLLIAALVALVAYGHGLAFPEPGGRAARLLRLSGHTLGLLGAAFLGTILCFYVVPLGWMLLKGFLAFGWVRELGRMLWHGTGAELVLVPLIALLLVYSATLLCFLPPVVLHLYGAAFRRSAREAAALAGRPLAAAVVLVVVASNVALFLVWNRQPQRTAWALLAAVPTDDGARRALLREREQIRAGLLNAYLAPQRYLGARGNSNQVAQLFSEAFHMPPSLGARLQRAHDALARPVLYDGASLHGDRAEAERRYAEFFDQPLQRGERQAVRQALSATYDRGRREAGLLAIDDCQVHLVEQQAYVVEEDGPAAELELHEVYENQTTQPAEVFYYFNLPDGAVPTGLWLQEEGGPKHAFSVSPRGAAQRVYLGEVRRQRDPALLEQIGPRQFRLRAFPIPPRPPLSAGVMKPTPRFHLWLRYAALADGGALPLPVLGEKRNVCWGPFTRRAGAGWTSADAWWPPSLPSAGAAPRPRTFSLGTHVVRALPAHPATLPDGVRLALVLDRSHSMGRVAREAADAIEALRAGPCMTGRCDLYLTAAASRGEAPSVREGIGEFDARAVIYYGGQRAGDLLTQQRQLAGGRSYDAILVLTDDGSLDLADDRGAAWDLGAPVYMVHLGGRLAPGYDDKTLRTMQRRGGAVVANPEAALQDLAQAMRARGGATYAGQGAGYLWTVERGAAEAGGGCPSGPWTKIAAGRLLAVAQRGAEDLEALDALHELAKACGVVTPYSSMIVLVDDAQREALRRAEADQDRFDRQAESGVSTLPEQPDLMVTGTPEPEEWLLLALGGALLLWMAARARAPVRGAPA